MTIIIDESERQFILLSLALCSKLRPGFDDAAGDIAELLHGREMFEGFKDANAHIEPQRDWVDDRKDATL